MRDQQDFQESIPQIADATTTEQHIAFYINLSLLISHQNDGVLFTL